MSVQVRDRVVRLSLAEFEALVAGELSEEEQGLVLGVPGMPEAIDGARDPLLMVQVDLAVARGGRTHFGWVGEDAVALMLPVDALSWQLLAVPVDQVAVSLARIVGLGPGGGGVRNAQELAVNPFTDFFSADEWVRVAALAAHDVDVAWTLGVRSPDQEWLMAAAAGGEGSWLFLPLSSSGAGDDPDDIPEDGDMPLRKEPVSATEIYRPFTAIVPGLLADQD